MNKQNKPKTLYAVWGNGYGFRGPTKVFWNDELKSWWAKNGNDEVKKIGLHWDEDKCNFSFSSKNLDEVNTFVEGYVACAQIVQNSVSYWGKRGKK